MTRESMEASGRLNGWKEIADYLGRSVRSVQRWENELCLPIHRLKTRNGQVVYAYRSEISEWLERTEVPPEPTSTSSIGKATGEDGATGADEAHDVAGRVTRRMNDVAMSADVLSATPLVVSANVVPVPEVPEDPRQPAARYVPPVGTRAPVRHHLAWLAVTAFALAAGVGIGRSIVPAIAVRPERVHVDGRFVEARDRADRVTWRRDLGEVVRPLASGLHSTNRDEVNDSIASADLDDDGSLEFLVPVRMGAAPAASVTDRLMAFEGDGRLRWSVAPEFSVECGGRTFKGPWELRAVTTSHGPGPARVWAAYSDSIAWPSFVVEIDANGGTQVRLFQAGWVMALGHLQGTNGSRLVAGGVLNEHSRASMTVVDLSKGSATLPPSSQAFTCNFAGGPPDRVSLLPTLEVTRAIGLPYEFVHRLTARGQDLRWEAARGQLVGLVGAEGRVTEYTLTDIYWNEHRGASQFNALTHQLHECPERTGPYEVREWTATAGWSTHHVGTRTGSSPVATLASNGR